MGMFGFTSVQSFALSNAIIYTGATIKFFGFSIWQRHPKKDATMIDYSICSIMLPLILVGSFTGVIISSVLPSAILTMMLTTILVYMTFDAFRKGIRGWKKECIEIEAKKLAYKPLGDSEEKPAEQPKKKSPSKTDDNFKAPSAVTPSADMQTPTYNALNESTGSIEIEEKTK